MKFIVFDPNTGRNEEISDLEQFIALCFYGEMANDYPASNVRESARLSVADFLKTQPLEEVRQVRIELQGLLNRHLTEAELRDVLLYMGMYLSISPYRPWLESVLSQIETFLASPPKPIVPQPPTRPFTPPPPPPQPKSSAGWFVLGVLFLAIGVAFFARKQRVDERKGVRYFIVIDFHFTKY